MDEMMSAMKHALNKGYSIGWAADVSEKGFSFRDGLAWNENSNHRKIQYTWWYLS